MHIVLDDVAGWGALLAESLDATGGPLSDDERAWADEVLAVVVSDAQDLRLLDPSVQLIPV